METPNSDAAEKFRGWVETGEWQDLRNRWIQELGTAAEATPKKLLEVMRPHVEFILSNRGYATHPKVFGAQSITEDKTCTVSQSMRAHRCLDEWESQKRTLEEFKKNSSDMRLLRDFLAVHRTVWILDGRPV